MYRTSLFRLALPLVVFFLFVATQTIAQQAAPQPPRKDADILITDFEFETFPSDWKVTGEAFGTGPVTGSLEKQSWGDLVAFQGKRFANSFHGGEGSVGTITLVSGKTTATYDAVAQRLDEMPLPMIDGRITIRLLIDRLQYELVGNDGAVYKTLRRNDAGEAIDTFEVQSQGGSAKLTFKIFQMDSIWK